MQLNIFLNAPGTTIKARIRPTGGFVVIESGLSDGQQALCNHVMIDGTPEQLLALADEIYREFREFKLHNYLPRSQPTADDEAARDFELLQEARANTPEAKRFHSSIYIPKNLKGGISIDNFHKRSPKPAQH